MLSCVIYKIISNYACIDYLAREYFFLSELPIGFEAGLKHRNKSYDKNIGNWNYRFVNELDVLSWLFEEHKSCCQIKVS